MSERAGADALSTCWYVSVCDMTHSYMSVCDMTHSYMSVCDMTHSYMGHNSFMHVTCLIHTE